MKQIPYTVYFTGSDYMYSMATKEAKERVWVSGYPEMFAPLVKDGVRHAFTLLKKTSPKVSEPVRKRDLVKIIGQDGDTDLLENLLGRPVYERRTIEEEFLLLGQNAESGNIYPADKAEWAGLISLLKNYFNGIIGQVKIVLSEDPGFYWEGRVSAAINELERYRAIVKIKADVEPYKKERYSSVQHWIWDDFSFIDGIIRDYGPVTVTHEENEYMTLPVPMRNRDIMPEFRKGGNGDAENAVQVSIDGVTWKNASLSSYGTIDGIVLEGKRIFGEVSNLYLKGNGKDIYIRMRGETL